MAFHTPPLRKVKKQARGYAIIYYPAVELSFGTVSSILINFWHTFD